MARMVARVSGSGKMVKKGDSVSLISRALSKELSNTGSPVLLTNVASSTTSVPVKAGRAEETLQAASTIVTRRVVITAANRNLYLRRTAAATADAGEVPFSAAAAVLSVERVAGPWAT